MCLIIDANMYGVVFSEDGPRRFPRLYSWIEDSQEKVVYGGSQVREEIRNSRSAVRQLSVWDQAALTREVPDEAVDNHAASLRQRGGLASNDAHYLALARVSGSRVICTDDSDLRDDFTNPGIIGNPKGRVYSESNATDFQGPQHRCDRNACTDSRACRKRAQGRLAARKRQRGP